MRHSRVNGFRVVIGVLGLALAGLGGAWADGILTNVYIATPDDRLVPKTPAMRDQPASAYSPDAVHTYRWNGGIYVEEEIPVTRGPIGVQADPATAYVDPAEVPPGNVIVQEPLELQEWRHH